MQSRFIKLIFLLSLIGSSAWAQDIPPAWTEDFATYANGAGDPAQDNNNPVGADWTVTPPGGGSFDVQGNEWVVDETDAEGVWTSEVISITNGNKYFITIDVGQSFFSFLSTGYIRAFYVLDGGSEVQFGEFLPGFGGAGNMGIYGLAPTATIQLVIRSSISSGFFSRTFSFDNVNIDEQTELFSIVSGQWDTNGTWSTTRLGLSCGCTPTATDFATVQNTHVVDIDNAVTSAGLTVETGGTVRWTVAGNVYQLANGSPVTVEAGATFTRNGLGGATIELTDATGGTYLFTNDGSWDVGSLFINQNDIRVGLAGGSNMLFSASIDIDEDDNVVTNNNTGVVTCASLFFDNDNSSFVNNGELDVTVQMNVVAATDDGNSFTNNAGATFRPRNFNFNGGTFTLTNNGTIDQSGVINTASAATLNHTNGATWNYAGATHDATVTLNVTGTNTFEYDRGGIQNIIDAAGNRYSSLTLSNSGTKTPLDDLDVDGDLTISGTARLDVNTGNFDINLAGNWVNTSTDGDPFEEGAERVTFDGTGAQGITYTAGEDFFNVTVNKAGGAITLNDPVSIIGTMIMTQGIVNTTTSELLTFEAGSGLGGVNATSYVNGPVSKIGNTGFTFPTGDGAIFARIQIAPAGVTAVTDEWRAEYIDAPQGDITVMAPLLIASRIEYWTLGLIAGAADAQVRLFWEDTVRSELFPQSDPADIVVARYNGVDWESEGQTGINTGASGFVTCGVIPTADFTAATPFTFGSLTGSSPLPVELLKFEAVVEEKVVVLNWATASEDDNDFFTVERSRNGLEFEEILFVDGTGNSLEKIDYQATDESPLNGLSFYRLKQTDFDGLFEHSWVISIEYGEPINPTVEIFPNPTYGKLFVQLDQIEDEQIVQIGIFSLKGDIIMEDQFLLTPDTDRIELDHLMGKSSGLYFLNIRYGTTNLTRRVLVQ